MSVVTAMGKYTNVQTEYAIKDNLPRDATNITAQIIVGTPGTMVDLMRRKVIDVTRVKVFVLDEADNMLDQDGLGEQTLRVKNLLPRTPYQIILFSATFPDHVRLYASKIAPAANKIELQKEELSVDNIRQFYMDCRNEEHKYDILVGLYQLLTIGQSIIFCQVRLGLLLHRGNSILIFLLFSIDTQQIGSHNG
jgi:ATP-dependent RNA helicase DDX19/DBP5